jgi:hypothetical protein
MSRLAHFADSNAFFYMAAAAKHAGGREYDAWSRFALEIDPANIVAPHLYAFPRRPLSLAEDHEACTLEGPVDVAVFAYRLAQHREFLDAEVVPLVRRICPHVLLADTRARTFREVGTEASVPLSELARVLDHWTAPGTFEPPDLDHYEAFFRLREDSDELTRLAARLENAPLRLWEMMFSRGFSGRYELLDNEVPLVAELGTELAANRSLMQCVRDAEAFCRCEAVDDHGWIRTGRFRMRQLGTILEVRVSLTAADVRVAFAPRGRKPGSDALPSLLGVLLAGGDNGKTELVNGFTWSTVICRDDAEVVVLSTSLREEIARWTGARAVVAQMTDFPDDRDGTWMISPRPHPRHPLVTVYVPMQRDECLPFWMLG